MTCIERAHEFDTAARQRVREAGLDSLIDLIHADAREFALEGARYDAALCLGASFIWDGLAGTLAALTPTVRSGGFVAVGEPYWRVWPLPEGVDVQSEDYFTLPETVRRFQASDLTPIALLDASLDDWDRYETLHWHAAEEWLIEHPHDPNAEEIRLRIQRDREQYLRWQRDLLGWAIIAGRKR